MKHWLIGLVAVALALVIWSYVDWKRDHDAGMEKVDRSVDCILHPDEYYCDEPDFGVDR